MAAVKVGLLSLKGSHLKLAADTKGKDKKFLVAQVAVGNGFLWYYNKDSSITSGPPVEVFYMVGYEMIADKDAKPGKTENGFEFVLQSKYDKKWNITFAADSEDEKQGWVDAICDTIDSTSPRIFETTIQDAAFKANRILPPFITTMFQVIEPHFKSEGIFRLSGNSVKIVELKEQLNKGEEVDFKTVGDINTVTGLLKAYFRDLSNPLIPFSFFNRFLAAASGAEGDALATRQRDLLSQVPDINRIVLSCLMRFLKRVSLQSASNKMTPENLAIVFGPTILRSPPLGRASKDELSGAVVINKLAENLISFCDKIFSVADEKTAVLPARGLLRAQQDDIYAMPTAEEIAGIEPVLALHNEPLDSVLITRVLKKEKKSLDEALLVVGANRVYLFSRGKLDVETHFFDIQELSSPNGVELKLVYGTPKPQEFAIRAVSYASYDIDQAVVRILQQNDLNNIGMPADQKFTANIQPADRERFVRTYSAVCDHLGVPLQEDICWDLDNLYYLNDVKSFNLAEFVHRERFPNDEFTTLMRALQNNVWFTSLILKDQKLGAEVSNIANVFKTNKSIKKLKLVNVGPTNSSMDQLAQAFKLNPPSFEELDISFNPLEEKTMIALAASIEKFQALTKLNISGCNFGKKGINALLEALLKNSVICSSMLELDLSGNSLHDQETCKKLGLFLGKATGLKILNVANTQTQWQFVCVCFEKSQSITKVNISDLKVSAKTQDDLVLFLKQLPLLTKLIMSNVTVTIQNLLDILSTHSSLLSLDVSDNDFSDEGVIALAEYFQGAGQDKVLALEELNLNRMFGRRTKARAQAIDALNKILEVRPIRRLRIRGGPKSRLQQDLLSLIFGLSNNKVLEMIDLSGNQAGDALAVALGKVLQHNKTLNTMYWDDNLTTMAGLKIFQIGLERNFTLKKMPLPLLDMAAVLKEATDLTAVIQVSNEIQQHVFDNCLAKDESTQAPSPASAIPGPSAGDKSPMGHKRSASKAGGAANRGQAKIRRSPANSDFKPVDVSRASKLFGQATMRSGLLANVGVVPTHVPGAETPPQ